MEREIECTIQKFRDVASDRTRPRPERRGASEIVRWFEVVHSPYTNKLSYGAVGTFVGSLTAELLGANSWWYPFSGFVLFYLIAVVIDVLSDSDGRHG